LITKGKTDTPPEHVKVRSEGLELLDQFLLEQIEAKHVQAAGYILSRYGKIFAHGTMGALSGLEEEKGGFLPDSIHAIASGTKVFTATAIMQLVEQGKLSLEQPLSTFMPEFANPMHEKITVFHLMTHTSGLPADPGAHVEPYPRPFWSDEINETNWVSFMLRGPIQYPVGEVYNYCTAGFMLLGEVVARISGVSYTEYMHQRIFEPLGMMRTFFDVPDKYRQSVCLVTEMDVESLDFPRERSFVGSWAAGGGIYSTLIDIWKFGQMMLNKGTYNGQRILSRKSVEAMIRNHLHAVPTYNWGIPVKAKPFGLGWEIDKDPTFSPGTISHEGFGWTSLFVDPQEELVYVCMTPTKNDWWVAKPMVPRTIVLAALE
jgi:CubicO group peptidase (beta-lactamase class C family)